MTTIKELIVQSVGEPYSVKIERGQKGGIGYEVSVKSDDRTTAVNDIYYLINECEIIRIKYRDGGNGHEEQKA